MNPDNLTRLDGTLHGSPWTRWPSRERGQVRFWLSVARDLAGDGYDLFLVAIEPRRAEEVRRLEEELRDGRRVIVYARARSLIDLDVPLRAQERAPGVIFLADECGPDGLASRSAHELGAPHRRHRPHGKMAAAGDTEGELQLQEAE